MADTESPADAREKPLLDESMSSRSSFKKKFVCAHAVPAFDQPMLIYHGGMVVVFLMYALLGPLVRFMLDDDRGFHSAVIEAMLCIFGAIFYGYLLINPPERVELYTNRIVVRLHR